MEDNLYREHCKRDAAQAVQERACYLAAKRSAWWRWNWLTPRRTLKTTISDEVGWKFSCDLVSGRLCSRSNALLVSCYPGLSNGKGAGHEGAAAVLF